MCRKLTGYKILNVLDQHRQDHIPNVCRSSTDVGRHNDVGLSQQRMANRERLLLYDIYTLYGKFVV